MLIMNADVWQRLWVKCIHSERNYDEKFYGLSQTDLFQNLSKFKNDLALEMRTVGHI